MPKTNLLAAKWILPITAPPILDGVIAFGDDKIDALGPRHEFSDLAVEDLGEVVLMPGLINAHTHLELGHLRDKIESPADLADWILQLLTLQRSLSDDELSRRTVESINLGIKESLDFGVTTVGDITRFGSTTRPILQEGPLRVVSFGEVLGIGRQRHTIEERLREAGDAKFDSDYLTTAVSAHSPYSLEAAGIDRVVGHARQHNMYTCIHAAETKEEIQFLRAGDGRFRDMLQALEVWDSSIPIPGVTPVRWLGQIGALGPDCLVAHGNYLDDQEIDMLCATGTSVAYCPRTHSYFGHSPHPLLKMLGAGVNVCVGTDSLASNPSLSILEELAHICRLHPELSTESVLTMGTISGARALGLAHKCGSLEPQKQADLAIFGCADGNAKPPEKALLTDSPQLDRLYIAGRRVR